MANKFIGVDLVIISAPVTGGRWVTIRRRIGGGHACSSVLPLERLSQGRRSGRCRETLGRCGGVGRSGCDDVNVRSRFWICWWVFVSLPSLGGVGDFGQSDEVWLGYRIYIGGRDRIVILRSEHVQELLHSVSRVRDLTI